MCKFSAVWQHCWRHQGAKNVRISWLESFVSSALVSFPHFNINIINPIFYCCSETDYRFFFKFANIVDSFGHFFCWFVTIRVLWFFLTLWGRCCVSYSLWFFHVLIDCRWCLVIVNHVSGLCVVTFWWWVERRRWLSDRVTLVAVCGGPLGRWGERRLEEVSSREPLRHVGGIWKGKGL